MLEPARVRDCIAAMVDAVDVSVTVKTRIGVDEDDSEAFLHAFVDTVLPAGVDALIVHARKAWLSGLSPKQNRDIPPLIYDRVYGLRTRYPDQTIVVNGGVVEIEAALEHLKHVDGLMLGRAAYQNPWILVELGSRLGHTVAGSRREVVASMSEYAEAHLSAGGRLSHIARHMLGLFHGQPGARAWRQRLSQNMHKPAVEPSLLLDACPEGEDGGR